MSTLPTRSIPTAQKLLEEKKFYEKVVSPVSHEMTVCNLSCILSFTILLLILSALLTLSSSSHVATLFQAEMPPSVRTAFEKQHRIFNRLKEQNDFLVSDIAKVSFISIDFLSFSFPMFHFTI
jgi:hypothetical protein